MTRNIYISISRFFRDSEKTLKYSLYGIAIFGFVLLLILSQIFDPKVMVGFGGRLWFSLVGVLGVIIMAVSWFNPDRDPLDKSSNESFYVFLLNCCLFLAAYVWFME